MGDYVAWDQRAAATMLERDFGWRHSLSPKASDYQGFNGIDCDALEVNDYLKYLKYGYDRATDSACIDVRKGYISRDEAVRLVQRYGGRVPQESIWRFVNYLERDMEWFLGVAERFTNTDLFARDPDGAFSRDIDGRLVPRFRVA